MLLTAADPLNASELFLMEIDGSNQRAAMSEWVRRGCCSGRPVRDREERSVPLGRSSGAGTDGSMV
jgi:hypothetical protein